MRGRRPDVVSQDMKGNPGKRRKARISIEDRIRSLADAPSAPGDPLGPPIIFGLDEFSGTIAIWSEYAPILRRRNLLDRLDRHTLAMFCYYLDRFYAAVTRLAQDGETQRIKTVAGGYMIRNHPSVQHRDDAAKVVLDMSVRFGFTPLDRHKLIREIAGAGQPTGGLFGDEQQTPAAPDTPHAAPEEQDDITGFAQRHSTTIQ